MLCGERASVGLKAASKGFRSHMVCALPALFVKCKTDTEKKCTNDAKSFTLNTRDCPGIHGTASRVPCSTLHWMHSYVLMYVLLLEGHK